jgi:hypothetical protein
MNENMKSSLTGVLQVNDTTPNVVRINALTRYMTNMANMWSGRSLFNKLLGKLLDVLLRIHLVPTREQKYQEWVAKKKTDREESKNTSKITSDKTDFWCLSRNQKRDIIRSELYKFQKYQTKHVTSTAPDRQNKWFTRKNRSEARIQFFKFRMAQVRVSF